MKQIAVIGLGLMGTSISLRLMEAGYSVTGFDIVRSKATSLAQHGLKEARSAKEACRGADLTLLSLPSWEAVLEAVEGKDGIIRSARRGQIIADTSTSPPWESRALGQRLSRRGIEWMDIPISGSSVQARVGNMLFMVGGKKSLFKKVKPVLDSIGKKTVYAGRMGDAATLKVVINHTLNLNQAAAIEGMVLGLKAGLAPDLLYEVMSSGGAASDQLISRGKAMLAGDFTTRSTVSITKKDTALGLEMGKRLGVVLPIAAVYLQFLQNAQNRGWDQKDATIVMKIYEELANFTRKGGKLFSKKKKKY
jgi:2-hydroxymethylglutarate dehydrogenase